MRRRSRRLTGAGSSRRLPSPAAGATQPQSILLLTIELIVSALAFIAEPRDVAAAAQACRHFERAASFEAAWQHCWYALIAGKVYVPPRAAALVSARVPQFRSGIVSALAEIKAAAISIEQLIKPVWEGRSKPTRWHDKHDGWLKGKPCGAHRLNSDGSVKIVSGTPPEGLVLEDQTETWRFVRRCGGRIVPFGTHLRTRVTTKGGSYEQSTVKAGSYELPPRKIMHRAPFLPVSLHGPARSRALSMGSFGFLLTYDTNVCGAVAPPAPRRTPQWSKSVSQCLIKAVGTQFTVEG